MKNKLFEFLRNNAQRTNLRTIKSHLENYNKWSLENKSYDKMNFYKSYIHYFAKLFPVMIKNKQVVELNSQHYKPFSEFHFTLINNKVEIYYKNLNQFHNMTEIHNILDKIYNDSYYILDIVNALCCYENIDNLTSVFNSETCNLILEYIFMTILYNYHLLCEDENMIYNIQTQQNVVSEFDINIGIDEITQGIDDMIFARDDDDVVELNIDILEGNKKIVKEKIASLLLTFIEIYNNHKNIINKTYDDIQNYIFNLKEKEKNLITDRQERLEREEKDVDALMKTHKLGVWGKGLNKGLTKYVKKDYDEDLDFRDKMNAIENKLNNKNGFNINTSGLYDTDVFDEYDNITRDKEIEDEEYDMSHIGDDGDILYDNVNEDNYDDYDY